MRITRGNGSSSETGTRIPRRITRNMNRMIKVRRRRRERRRRIEQKHKDCNEKQEKKKNRSRQTDKTTNMLRRIRVRRSRI